MPTLVVDQVLNGTALGLSFGLVDMLALTVGGQRKLYALSRTENALVELTVASNGALTVAGSLALGGSFAAGSDPQLAAFDMVGGATSLAIGGMSVSPGQTVSLGLNGALGAQTPLPSAGVLASPSGGAIGSTEILVTGHSGASGLDLLTDTGSGYAQTSTLADVTDRYLEDVSGAVTFKFVGVDYVATTSAGADGVNLAEVSSTALIQSDALGVPEGLPINMPTEIDVVQRLGETLLVVGSSSTSSLSVLNVASGGTLQIADHILDASYTHIQGVTALDAITYSNFAFVAAGGAEAGISLFTVLPGGRLVHLDSFSDTTTSPLYRVSAVELATTGARLDMMVSSSWNSGITRLGYDLSGLGSVLVAGPTGGTLAGTGGDDQIVGSEVSDTLVGGAGADIIADGAGQDVLTGGLGADLFVMHPDGQQDVITDYDKTVDRLDLSAYDFLYDVSQLTITPTSDGAVLSHGAETLVIHAANSAPLTIADFTNATILNVDRPPLVPFAQQLDGSAAGDTLIGAAGADTINGAAGDDLLTGQGGDDSIDGGTGNDRLEGNSGSDTLSGQSGGDTLIGGTGDDLLFGNAGNDLIYGDDWSGA